jgi:Tol biopolymer transport system component
MHRLSDGKATRLIEPSMGGHISGRGFKNPGWALVSVDINRGGSSGYYYATQLFEVKLDGSGTIRHFGYARTSCTTYDNYPFGSVSPDGKKVAFNSDWLFEKGSGDALAYVSEYAERTTDVDEFEGKSRQMSFELMQNYPNPFNPTTLINYRLKEEGMTKLVVYNVLGQKVKVLINENMRAGSYSTPFNGSSLPSGLYFYKLETKNQIRVKKMMLIK